jgi:hypothetical protein
MDQLASIVWLGLAVTVTVMISGFTQSGRREPPFT